MPMLERPSSKAGWTRVRFDQIATQINDRVDNPAEAGVERYVGLEHLDPDSLRIRRWGEPTDVESTKLRFQPGDIIFGKRRVYQRKVAVADFEGICSAHAMVLRAKPGEVLPDFLPFFMQSDLFMERALSISVGSLSPTINWKALAAEEFLLPPIQEQARLVELLTGLDLCRSNYAACIDAIHTMKRAAVRDEFALRKAHAHQRIGEKAFTLTDLCRIRTGKLDSNAAVEGGRYPYFTCDPVPKTINDYAFDCEAILLPGNNAQGIFWVKTYHGRFNAYQRTYVIEVISELARLDYIAQFLEDQLANLRNLSVGSTTKYLTMDLFSKLSLVIPPVEQQDRFLSIIKSLDRELVTTGDRLSKVGTLGKWALASLGSEGCENV
ncbi:restriction endonuclease subunit S [Pseudotabrizicola sp. L79]|uniref:restriction endonuclease subunit S n=1 Tax=Pseudotabrizicola sp. L79 TaxID=3118402 RepID=UPI002F94DA34